MDHQHGNVERFLKLGYSHGDILRVLESLRHGAQTNDILEELIKTCHSRSTSNNNRTAPAGSMSSPQLVPRGCGSPRPSTAPGPDRDPAGGFRPVVIDGSNVAMSHGDKRVFSCHGLQLAVKWFWDRGARDITVFVPLWRKEQPRPEAPITDQHILHELERRKILVFTPSRCVNGKRVVCYDDRYIIKLAFDSDGIIVSNDNYRDLQTEKPLWKKFIEERLLMYSFVNDKFMPPDDPLGRNGPTIDNFLRKKSQALDNKQQHCPYGKKCTYGVKCKFYHPERANQSQLSVADELRAMSRPGVDREQSFVPPPALSHRVGLDSRPYSAPNLYRDLEHTTLPHRYSSTPPLLRTEEQPHRTSPSEQLVSQRDTGSPALLPNSSLRLCPSPDSDEAFGSLDSSMSRFHIQDMSKSTERLSYAYSSGVAGCSQGSGDFHLSGSYNTSTQRLSVGGGPYAPPRSPPCGHNRPQTCENSSCNQCRYGPQHAWPRPPPLPGGTYGAHIHNDSDGHIHLSDEQYFRRPLPYRVGNSLPECHCWGQGSHSDGELMSGAKTPSSEQRRSLRSQLSTLYPQSLVEQVMCSYPHVMDMSELLPLIQRYRNSLVSF